ncbi:MAG: YeiH family protein [Bacteriovoracales bacterium]
MKRLLPGISQGLTLGHFLFPLAVIFTLTPWASSGGALVLGIILALLFGNPYSEKTKTLPNKLLQISVIGLGAGMNLAIIAKVGLSGIGYTLSGITLALILGNLFGRWLKVGRDTSLLISIGTAICGGSAIAAVTPVIKAKHHDVSVALGTVFMLNALALFLFPWIGHKLTLTQTQFGLWSALAIHDTSSVVGATLQFGPEALKVGTTVKLARALWIMPVAFLVGFLRRKEPVESQKAKRPWFILGFIIAASVVTFIPSLQPAGHVIESLAKRLMVLTLFLIGTGLNRAAIKSVGPRPFIQGILLWLTIGSLSLGAIWAGWIS